MSYKDIQDIIEKRKAIKEAQKRKMRTPALHGASIVSLDKDGNVIGEAPVASATAPAESAPAETQSETPVAPPVETPSEEKPVEAEAAEEKPAEPEAPKKVKKYQKKKKASAPEENAD